MSNQPMVRQLSSMLMRFPCGRVSFIRGSLSKRKNVQSSRQSGSKQQHWNRRTSGLARRLNHSPSYQQVLFRKASVDTTVADAVTQVEIGRNSRIGTLKQFKPSNPPPLLQHESFWPLPHWAPFCWPSTSASVV